MVVKVQMTDKMFDELCIYNTNEEEVTTDQLAEAMGSGGLHRFFKELKLIKHMEPTKSLAEEEIPKPKGMS